MHITLGRVLEEIRREGQLDLIDNDSAADRSVDSSDNLARAANAAHSYLAKYGINRGKGIFATRNPEWMKRRVSRTITTVGDRKYLFLPKDCFNLLGVYSDSTTTQPEQRADPFGFGGDLYQEGNRIRYPDTASGTRYVEYQSDLSSMLAQGPTASATSTTLVATATSYASVPLMTEENYYQLLEMEIVSGTGAGQVRRIASYSHDGTQGTFTPSSAWTTTPDNTSVWALRSELPHTFGNLLVLEALQRLPQASSRFAQLIPVHVMEMKEFRSALHNFYGAGQ